MSEYKVESKSVSDNVRDVSQNVVSDSNLEPPWYRQFWPWALISLPAITVVAGIITMVIAVKNPYSMVNDNYYKEGLAINVSKEKEQRAIDLGVYATLTKDDSGQARLEVFSKQDVPAAEIRVELTHPTQQTKDLLWHFTLDSQRSFILDKAVFSGRRWYVRVSDNNDRWLLTGTWFTDQALLLGHKP